MARQPEETGKLVSLRQGTTDARVVEAYYDDWARTYDATLQSWQYRAPEDAADLLAPHLAPGMRALDVGCGTGQLGQALRARAALGLDGLDISAASLALARKRGIYDQLHQHDLQDIPLQVSDSSYDIAASVGVLTYIEDAEALLRDLCRAVRKGGIIAFTQRSDLWDARDFPGIIARMEVEKLWQPITVSDPLPYLPGNDDFADEIRVFHVLARVA